jgi:hypothetical protein
MSTSNLIGAENSSELIYSYKITRYHNAEDDDLNILRCESLRPYT